MVRVFDWFTAVVIGALVVAILYGAATDTTSTLSVVGFLGLVLWLPVAGYIFSAIESFFVRKIFLHILSRATV